MGGGGGAAVEQVVEPESGARWSIRTKIGEKAKVIHEHKIEGEKNEASQKEKNRDDDK